jgi:hypothetical protein
MSGILSIQYQKIPFSGLLRPFDSTYLLHTCMFKKQGLDNTLTEVFLGGLDCKICFELKTYPIPSGQARYNKIDLLED